MDVRAIMRQIPHRYPFLLLDRVEQIEKLKRIVAIKCVSVNEPFFQGHFPAAPVMPGVLIIEALAQAMAVLVLSEVSERESKLVYFTGIDECRFRRPVVPGDVLKLEVEITNLRARAGKARAVASVEGETAAEASLFSVMVDRT
jgi:beta-hydroxyacyl-ACP dehydratase FabZ